MSVHLMNGTTTKRSRASEGCDLQPCGCAHDGVRWLQLCSEHHSEWEALHAAASVDHNFGSI